MASNYDFSVWLEGAPVVPPGSPGDFSIWLDNAPVLDQGQAVSTLAGTIHGISTATGNIVGLGKISATVNTGATVTGSITTLTSLAGVIHGAATVTGSLLGLGHLSGNLGASASVSGGIVGFGKLSVVINGTSFVTGTLSGPVAGVWYMNQVRASQPRNRAYLPTVLPFYARRVSAAQPTMRAGK